MEWDYTLPRDMDADYVYGGLWYTTEELNAFAQQSPKYIPFPEFSESSLSAYHREWADTSDTELSMRPFHKTSASLYGRGVESMFIDYVKESPLASFTLTPAGKFDDHIHRTDFFLKRSSLCVPIDIKALKSVRDHRRQNKYFWVELHKNGFLFSTQSRSTLLIVEVNQEKTDKFIILDKAALKALVQEKFEPSLKLPPVMAAPQALERAYRRKGERQEWLGFLDFQDCVKKCAVSLVF
jgi:hypothetical protein